MKYLAILRDSWHEATDRKSLYFLLAVSTLIIAVVGLIGFQQVPVEEAVQTLTRTFRSHTRLVFPQSISRSYNVDYHVRDIAVMGKEQGFERFENGYRLTLAALHVEQFQRLVLFWDAVERGLIKTPGDADPGIDAQGKIAEPPTKEKMEAFLRSKFAEANLPGSKVTFIGIAEDAATFSVVMKPQRYDTLAAGHQVTFCFGLWKRPLREWSVGDFVAYEQNLLAGLIAGWVGVIIAVVVTAGFIPNMLQKGTLDVLLSKPIHRPALIAYKYLGGLTYVFVNATYLVGGIWFVTAVRSGIWSPGFLTVIPLLTFFFAILYAVSAFFGVVTRNAIVPILMSMIAWFGFWLVGQAYMVIHLPGVADEVPGWITKLVDGIHAVLPRIDQIDQAISWSIAKANGITPEHYPKIFGGAPFPVVEWGGMLATGFVFIAILLSAACWIFSRRDH